MARYAYSASGDTGDTGDATLDGLGTVVEATIPLIGGVLLTTRTAGNVWSYPNIHGDVVITVNGLGVKQGSVLNYDPYGQALSMVPDRHRRRDQSGSETGVPGLRRCINTDGIGARREVRQR